MELFINDQNVDIKLEGEKTVGEVLKAVQSEAESNNATIVEISVNDKIVPASDYEATANTELKDDTKICVQLVCSAEIDSSLEQVSQALCQMGKKLVDIPVLLQTGKNKDADLIIKDFADSFNSFCQLASLTALFPEKYEDFLIGENNINDFFKDFAPIVNDLAEAYSEKDTVTVGDLCEYEISPRLLQISDSVNKFLNK